MFGWQLNRLIRSELGAKLRPLVSIRKHGQQQSGNPIDREGQRHLLKPLIEFCHPEEYDDASYPDFHSHFSTDKNISQDSSKSFGIEIIPASPLSIA